MKTAKPHVKLITLMDGRESAWMASRPKFSKENLHLGEIGKMDLSLNSMKAYTLEFRSSSFFRDLVFSLRPISGWALSIRSMPISRDTLRTSEEFRHLHDDDKQIDDMLVYLEEGGERDNVRGMLRMSISTVYTVTLDHRVLLGFCKAMDRLNRDLFNIYGVLILNAVNGWDDYDSCNYADVGKYYEINDDERQGGERTERVGGMIFGYYNMKVALASQFLRQHYSKIKIGFWNKIPNYFNESISQSDNIEVAFYIDKQSYAGLMSLRSHWVIDWSMDMWGGIVSDYIKGMPTEDFWEFIPNGAGKEDPYYADVYNRILGEDPGLPCPIMCQWPEMLDRKKKQVGDSPLIQKYYDLFAEGYVLDNPDNENRVKYLKLQEEQICTI